MRFLYFILLVFSFSSCYTYKVFPKEYRTLNLPFTKSKAYITNPQLRKEYQILKNSELFELVDMSSADIRITLDTLRRSFVCGQPVVVSTMTLGQIPVYMPDRYTYSFTESKGDESIGHSLELQVAKRIWFWDIFNPDKGFPRKAGLALRGSYQSHGGGFGKLSN